MSCSTLRQCHYTVIYFSQSHSDFQFSSTPHSFSRFHRRHSSSQSSGSPQSWRQRTPTHAHTRLIQALLDLLYFLTAHFVRLEPTSVFSVVSLDTANMIAIVKYVSLPSNLYNRHRHISRRPRLHRMRLEDAKVDVAESMEKECSDEVG